MNNVRQKIRDYPRSIAWIIFTTTVTLGLVVYQLVR